MAVILPGHIVWETMAPQTYAVDDGYTSKTKENIERFSQRWGEQIIPFENKNEETTDLRDFYKKEAQACIRRNS